MGLTDAAAFAMQNKFAQRWGNPSSSRLIIPHIGCGTSLLCKVREFVRPIIHLYLRRALSEASLYTTNIVIHFNINDL
jgi:hypothetical protein